MHNAGMNSLELIDNLMIGYIIIDIKDEETSKRPKTIGKEFRKFLNYILKAIIQYIH